MLSGLFGVLLGRSTKRERETVRDVAVPKTWFHDPDRPHHDGDCAFTVEGVCTCGLIHHLVFEPPDAEWYRQESAQHSRTLHQLKTAREQREWPVALGDAAS